MLNLRYQALGQMRNMDKRQHQHCFFIRTQALVRHLEPQVLVYAWYIRGIFHPYGVLIHMDGICMVYTWHIHGISIVMDIPRISKDIHGISTKYMHGICMVYAWYII